MWAEETLGSIQNRAGCSGGTVEGQHRNESADSKGCAYADSEGSQGLD